MIKVIITGSTGMVGKGVLLECLDNPSVSNILVINRHSLGMQHPKLKEVITNNFYDLSPLEYELSGYDACYFCLGVSSFRMKEENYHHITYDLTISVANTLLKLNPNMVFCYVSGQGTDSTEKGNTMWARVKGKTENALLAMPFKDAYMFRPGYIHPMPGVKSRTPLYNTLIPIIKPLYPILKRLFPNSTTTSQAIGKAMIAVTLKPIQKHILTSSDINQLAKQQ